MTLAATISAESPFFLPRKANHGASMTLAAPSLPAAQIFAFFLRPSWVFVPEAQNFAFFLRPSWVFGPNAQIFAFFLRSSWAFGPEAQNFAIFLRSSWVFGPNAQIFAIFPRSSRVFGPTTEKNKDNSLKLSYNCYICSHFPKRECTTGV